MPKIMGKEIGSVGFGLMGLTWRPNPPPVPQAIRTMRKAISSGANFWNAGEFYGTQTYNSLHLLNEYFTQYPEDADKVVLSIKGGLDPETLMPDCSAEGVKRSVEACLAGLGGKKTLDIFECARIDPNVPVEETINALKPYVDSGKIGGIALSEVKAETIVRASKIVKIVAVEIEVSLWATDCLSNGIATTCAELGVPIVAYSPLGRGFLTGDLKTPEDIPAGDFRRYLPRFQPDVWETNLQLVAKIKDVAQRKGCTSAQLAIGWVTELGKSPGMPAFVPIPGCVTEARVTENMELVSLDKMDQEELGHIIEKVTIIGDRYGGPMAALMNG